MTYKGRIHNRAVVLDEAVQLPEGAEVTVEVTSPADVAPSALGGPDLFVDPWVLVEKEIAALANDSESLLNQELLPPTHAALHRVTPLLASLRKQLLDPPYRTLPDGQGGIVLEWIDALRHEMVRTIEISADGTVEVTEFSNNRLQSRRQIN